MPCVFSPVAPASDRGPGAVPFPPVRLGLVGLSWGERVARAAATLPTVRLAACFARTATVREEFAGRFGCTACPTYDAMLADASLDGVVVMTPNGTHRELAVAALRAGKHVLVTKPIAANLADARAMIAAAAEAGKLLMVGHQSRRQPAVRKLKALLAEGALGQVASIEGNTSSSTGWTRAPGSWRDTEEECPGGPLLQLGIHYIDNFQYLLGNVVRVAAVHHRLKAGGGPPDVSQVLLELKSGATGTLTSSYVCGPGRWIRLAGTDAVSVFDGAKGLHLTRGSSPPEIVVPPTPMEEIIAASLREELAEFACCIQEGITPETGGAAGARNLAVVLAALESQRRRAWVEVEELWNG